MPQEDTVKATKRSARLMPAALLVTGAVFFTSCSTNTDSDTPAGTHSATPTTPSALASPSAEPIPSGDSVDVPSLVSDTVAAGLTEPSTGERWHTRAPYLGEATLLAPSLDASTPSTLFEIGTRGDSFIVAAVADQGQAYVDGYGILGVFEVDPDGGARLIACPSVNASSACVDVSTLELGADVEVDTQTHYASLTYPELVTLPDGWSVRAAVPSASWNTGLPTNYIYGAFPADAVPDDSVVGTLGTSALIGLPRPSLIPGTTTVDYQVRTPFGSLITHPWSPATSPAYDSVAFSDGSGIADIDGDGLAGLQAPAPSCVVASRVTVPSAQVSSWQGIGVTADGAKVSMPSPSDPLAAQIYAAIRDANEDGDYVHATIEDFVATRSLLAIDLGAEAVLAIHSDAAQHIYDCL